MAQQNQAETIKMLQNREFEGKKAAFVDYLSRYAERFLYPLLQRFKFDLVIQMCQDSIKMLDMYEPNAKEQFPLQDQLDEEVKSQGVGGKHFTLSDYLRIFILARREGVQKVMAIPFFSPEEKSELVSMWTDAFKKGKVYLARQCESAAKQAKDYEADPAAFIAAHKVDFDARTARIIKFCSLKLSL